MTAVNTTLDDHPSLVLVRMFEKIPETKDTMETPIPMWTLLNRNSGTIYIKGTVVPVIRRIQDLLAKSMIYRSEPIEYFYATACSSDDGLASQAVRLTVGDILPFLQSIEEGLEVARGLHRKEPLVQPSKVCEA